jgi:hypothetical protein
MADQVSILSLADRDRWEAEHLDGGLPAQSWRYAHALSASGIDPQLAVIRTADARMLVPFFEREWSGHTDVSTVVGLSGASILPSSPSPLSAWRDYATARGWVASYMQLAVDVDLDRPPPGDEIVTSNEVFLLDLTDGDVFSDASRTLRVKVRKATAAGTRLSESDGVLAEELNRLYPSAMTRLGARSLYRFSAETLSRWANDPSSIILGAEVEGSIEAVTVFLVAGHTAEHHVHGSTAAGRDLMAWLIANAVPRLRELGVRTLNLGGGIRRGDGVHRFKARFHGVPRPVRGVRQIFDRQVYERLSHAAGVQREEARWFPAYRTHETVT